MAVNVGQMANVVFVRFLLCQITFSLFFLSLKGELCHTSLKTAYLHKLFGIILHRRFVYSPRLFISVWIHGYYIQIIIQHYFILLLKLFQYEPSEALSVVSSVPFIYLSLFFEYFLTFQHYKMLQVHLIHYFLSQSWTQPFLQEAPVPFMG